MAADAPRTWVLTGMPENYAATASRGFTVNGIKGALVPVRRWPSGHWRLAFQGQPRTVSDGDAALLMDRMHAAAGVPP